MFVDFDVVILPSFAQVENWRKQRANAQDAGVFAQTATTFAAWIADLWELHGDGRAIVNDMQRRIALQTAFSTSGQEPIAAGVVRLAASCMRKASGVSPFEEALDAVRDGDVPIGITPREASFLNVLAQYEDAIEELGLIEPGFAAMALARQADRVFPRVLDVLMPDAPPLTWVQSGFFAACPQLRLTVEPAPGTSGIGPAPDGVDVRFAFPSGRLAEPGLIADIVLGLEPSDDVAVVCKDPLDMSGRVAQRLSASGLQVRVKARKPFAQTDFGRAFLSMYRCVHDDPWNPAFLSDAVFSPFAGFSQANAFAIDKEVRANRIAMRDDVLAWLRAQSEPFSQLEELASDPDADLLIGAFEQDVQASSRRSAAWRSEQLSAMAALREATAAARSMGADISACIAALEDANVSVTVRAGEDGPSVLFTTQALAARSVDSAPASVLVADLTSEDYPVADKDDAAATLFGKLGLPSEESALSRARRQFYALCNLPTGNLVIVQPLGDANADATYPSVVLEEFVDAYRPDVSATEDIDNAYRLPENLQGGLAERGEELLFANARADEVGVTQPIAAQLPNPHLGDLDGKSPVSASTPDLAWHLSPSQIEAFMDCPFQWFTTRRLRIDTLDEEFGPLEKGSFAHVALEAFYRQYQEAGYAKVAEQNMPAARALMRRIVDGLADAQFEQEPGSGRLVYANELERREVMALGDQLVNYLDFEARFLPTFHPAHFEYAIDADQLVEYAGAPLVGKVDRIDVDDRGHAVIIDYKGSLNGEHEIAGKTADHVGKVQTRIYAQAIKRVLGLDVVGALYVSYGKRPAVSGAYDPRLLDAAHLPGMRHDNCSCGQEAAVPAEAGADYPLSALTFGTMLDETERLVESAIAKMNAGEIEPNPAYPTACAYCPVLSCPKRGA